MLNITLASKIYYITRQAIAIAIKNKRLNAVKIKNNWCFTQQEWNNYEKSRYDRKYSIRDGKYLYDIEKGVLSPSMIAKEFGVDAQQVYYLLRTENLPHQRVGHAYVINREDFVKFLPDLKKKKKKLKK